MFQSTPPAWGATIAFFSSLTKNLFQSTPPAWGATKRGVDREMKPYVSIHAPRVGGDT